MHKQSVMPLDKKKFFESMRSRSIKITDGNPRQTHSPFCASAAPSADMFACLCVRAVSPCLAEAVIRTMLARRHTTDAAGPSILLSAHLAFCRPSVPVRRAERHENPSLTTRQSRSLPLIFARVALPTRTKKAESPRLFLQSG